jgi:prepilin-type processing-associated H-X9-DG protein
MKLRLAAMALLASSSIAFADGHAKTVVDLAVGSADHTTLVAAVQAAGLAETLAGAGPFTVFAPTNEAFAKLPAGTVEGLLTPESKDALTKILTCHVVGAQALAADVAKMIADGSGTATIETLGGCKLEASLDGEMVKIKDEAGGTATVTAADLVGTNGVIHVIDAVLLPAS